LHSIVCIKSVITQAPKGKILRTAENSALNPFDRPAIEVALRLKREHNGSVTALSMGPPTAQATLREALAMGADRAVLFCDPAFAGADTLATSTVLSAAVKFLSPYDLILFGTRTSDSDTGQVGPQTAVLSNLPMVTGIKKLSVEDGHLEVEREVDGFLEKYEISLPAALTIHPKAATPRDPALNGIAVAFDEMSVEVVGIDPLEIEPQKTGEAGSPTRVLSMKTVRKDRTCQWIEGTPVEQADTLVEKLLTDGLIG
jgi:electron transfer flavoprotein beta subunit